MARAALLLILISLVLPVTHAHGWGKRGHAIVCEAAAYLTAQKSKKSEFIKDHSFDLAYYCNVPDLVWKKGELYKKEWFNHFMDMEIFIRELKDARVEKPFALERVPFESAFPNIKESAGRAFWRINELMLAADALTAELKKTDLTREARQKLQAEWLVHNGVIGHYVGDLSQPLHLTENYDGQLTDQKGIHAWFEDELVNELYLGNGRTLASDIMKSAEMKWKKLNSSWEKKDITALLQDLADESSSEIEKLLKIDKITGRKNPRKAAQAFRKMIVERMSTGVVALSVLWIRQIGWDYDGTKFFTFVTDPDYINAPTAKAK